MTGDIYVYLRGGDHRITSPITFEVKDSGSGEHRIYYQGYPGETPVINGAKKVTGWTAHGGGVYKAALDRKTKLRNLYVNDVRANMTSKTVTAKGGSGNYAVTSEQGAWAWASGSGFDGVLYGTSDVPDITTNKDDLEIVNQTLWNENIVCVRDVVATGGDRGLMLQQPYGAIAQLPDSGANFSATGSHTIFNVFAWLTSAGQFYFDKTTATLYYYPRTGEDMTTADVEAPVAETLIDIAGTSNTNRVKNITIQGITFANTDYSLYKVEGSYGKSSVQGATIYIAYGKGKSIHDWRYEVLDTLPAAIIEGLRAVLPHVLQRELEAAIGPPLESLLGQRGPHHVSTDPLEILPIAAVDELLGVEVDTEGLGHGLGRWLSVARELGLCLAACAQAQYRLSRSLTRDGYAAGGRLVARKKHGLLDTERVGLSRVDQGVLVVPGACPSLLLESSMQAPGGAENRRCHSASYTYRPPPDTGADPKKNGAVSAPSSSSTMFPAGS